MRNFLLIFGILFAAALTAKSQEPKPVYYFNPDWSPNGKTILFESTKDGKFAIYTFRTDGSDLRKLTSGEFNDEQPRWSRDGRQVVFISDRDGHLQLYIMNADGSAQRRLTNAPDLDYLPDFSPKGDWVAFMSRPEQPSVFHDIYLIRADGTGRVRISDAAKNEMSPKWSPNGKKLLFEQNTPIQKNYRDMTKEDRDTMRNSQEIFVMNKDGSQPKNLTNNQVPDCCAVWSKSGKTIYFMSEAGGSPNIYSMNADGSNVSKIADGSVVRNPNISPDEKFFAYTKAVDKKWGLYIYEIKSGKERLLIGGK